MRVPYIDLSLKNSPCRQVVLDAMERVADHGQFVLGPEVEEFERAFAALCGVRYAVGVDNGTSALVLVMKGLGIGPGDEVITAPNSFLASASSVALCGARPVFVDVGSDYLLDPDLLEAAITPRTKAIIPVHLTGRPADMDRILAIADSHTIPVIEDAAQAVGALYRGKTVGSLGKAGCFSFHPLKNLNACGDGGIITTNDEELYRYLLLARTHGLRTRDDCEFWSMNARLDALQAAILAAKLPFLPEWSEARRAHAAFYREHLSSVVRVPDDPEHLYSVYHTFVIQADRRDELRAFLKEREIDTVVHYPVPIHLQKAALSLGHKKGDFPVTEDQADHIVSIPVFPSLTAEQRESVVAAIRAFYGH